MRNKNLPQISATRGSEFGQSPIIFVLRNNDIGDLVVITPLFEALRKLYPKARILAGIGAWNVTVLTGNPFIDEIVIIDAPWHNSKLAKPSTNPFFKRLQRWISTPVAALFYVLFSLNVRQLALQKPEIGIDVLGSRYGAWLFRRLGVRHNLGVRGYDGGERWMQQTIDLDYECYVGTAALKFAGLLGLPEEDLPSPKPQLFLTAEEVMEAEQRWMAHQGSASKRLVVGFGSGVLSKCWPESRFRELLELLQKEGNWSIVLVGGREEDLQGKRLAEDLPCTISLAGQLTLRQTFALTATSLAVVCNSSMLMHVASAFDKPTVVVLGHPIDSAEAHARLWSCNPQALVLGREARNDVNTLATAVDVFSFLQRVNIILR